MLQLIVIVTGYVLSWQIFGVINSSIKKEFYSKTVTDCRIRTTWHESKNMDRAKRSVIKPLPDMECELAQLKKALDCAINYDLASLGNDPEKIENTAKCVRKCFEDYCQSSYEFCLSLSSKGCIEEAQNAMTERHDYRAETHNAIKMINRLRSTLRIDTISNIDEESIAPQNKTFLSEPLAISSQIEGCTGDGGRKVESLPTGVNSKHSACAQQNSVRYAKQLERSSSQSSVEEDTDANYSGQQNSQIEIETRAGSLAPARNFASNMQPSLTTLPTETPLQKVASFVQNSSNWCESNERVADSARISYSKVHFSTPLNDEIAPRNSALNVAPQPVRVKLGYSCDFCPGVPRNRLINRNVNVDDVGNSNPIYQSTPVSLSVPRNANTGTHEASNSHPESNMRTEDAGNSIFGRWCRAESASMESQQRNNLPTTPTVGSCGIPTHTSHWVGPTHAGPRDEAFQHILRQDLMRKASDPLQGEPYRYHQWINLLNNRMKGVKLSALDVIDILLSNTSGKPHNLIKDFLSAGCQHPNVTLDNIMRALRIEYGATLRVSTELLKKLESFTPIKLVTDEKLKEFARLCKIIESNISQCPELQILNIALGSRMVIAKLPEPLRNMWRTTGHAFEKIHGFHPPFSEFVKFLQEKADEYSNPNYDYSSAYSSNAKYSKSPVVLKTDTSGISESVSKVSVSCPLHPSGKHKLLDCHSFLKLDYSEKKKIIFANKLCFRCLSSKHFRKECKTEVSCESCNGKHMTIMHCEELLRKKVNPERKTSSVPRSSNSKLEVVNPKTLCSTASDSKVNKPQSCSKTILVELSHKDHPDTVLKCYCIIDEQSNISFADSKVTDIFNIVSPTQEYLLTTMSGFKNRVEGKTVNGLKIIGIDNSKWYNLSTLLTNDYIPSTKHEIATPAIVRSHVHLSHLAHKFQELDEAADVLLLLGRDCGDLMRTTCYGRKAPFVHKTPVGWAMVGAAHPCQVAKSHISHEHYSLKTTCFDSTYNVFEERPDDEREGPSLEDRKFLSIMKSSVTVGPTGNLTMPLPFRDTNPNLPDNRMPVYCRTKNTLDRLKKNPSRWQECLDTMSSYIEAGHIEQLPDNNSIEPSKLWYLPVFPVVHPKKGTTRLVFDSSAVYGGTSLNKELIQGPDQNNLLQGVLQRFRINPVAFVGDIQKMFHCFHLPQQDKDCLRFFWYRNNQINAGLCEYRANVHIFGNCCSPAIANFGLRYAAKCTNVAAIPEARAFIENNIYVDDALGCSQSAEAAIQILKDARGLLSSFNIRLHKINSNSSEVLAAFPPSERCEDVKIIDFDNVYIQRTLGLSWDVKSDNFVLTVNLPEKPFTKRGILSVVNSLFDPLGFAAPIALGGRLIQRTFLPPKRNLKDNLHLETYDWDDPLPKELLPIWEAWKNSLIDAQCLKVPRSFVPYNFGSVCNNHLHVFSDASKDAIGYVIYVKSTNEQGLDHVAFVCAGAKVAPRCATSIPRMELCAAVEAVKATEKVIAELRLCQTSATFYTDSEVLLGYLSNSTRHFSRYVTRRIEVIISIFPSNKWYYVPTDVNPADIASRPHSPKSLCNSCWLKGPEFLYSNIALSDLDCSEIELPEIVPASIPLTTSRDSGSWLGTLMNRVSCLLKLKRIVRFITVNILRLVDRCRQRLGCHLAIRNDNIVTSETVMSIIVQCSQFHYYSEFFSKNGSLTLPPAHRLTSLSLFVDYRETIRLCGRITNSSLHYSLKHPWLIPYGSPLSHLILSHYHSLVHHQGRHLTHGAIQNAGFFLEKGTKSVRRFLDNCIVCEKLRGTLLEQKMADLPSDRLEEVPPFTNSGMDVFGPLHITDGNATRRTNATKKVWGILFTCLVSKAVHIEPLPSLDTPSFINAFRRFYAIRGNCKILRSDQGTNFMGARNLKESSVLLSSLETEILSKDCVWHVNPPHASHFGGIWERKIGSIRRIMDATYRQLGNRTLSRDEYSTLLAEVSAIINNTPLWAISPSADDLLPLSPSMLLTLRDSPNSQFCDSLTHSDLVAYGKNRWKRVQYLADQFWSRWRREYLQQLQERSKWVVEKPSLEIGDIVLIKDKAAKRNFWPLGRVVVVYKSKDNLVRSVSIKIPSKEPERTRVYERPICDVVLLMRTNQ